MLRLMKSSDIEDMLSMGDSFFKVFPGAGQVKYDKEKTREFLFKVLSNPSKFVGILQVDDIDKPVGMLIGAVQDPYFSNDVVAVELIMWVNPENRSPKALKQLVSAFEFWAKKMGASVTALSNFEDLKGPSLSSLYKRMGYTLFENTYNKAVN